MADQVILGSTGGAVAAELVAASTEYYQRIKLFDPTPTSTAPHGVVSNPFRIDPTGGTVQPVSGTFWQSTQPVVVSSGHLIVDSVSGTVGITAASLPLPDGAAQDVTLTNLLSSEGSTVASCRLWMVGGKTSDDTPQYRAIPLSAGGDAVKVDGSLVTQPVSGTFWQTTQPVSISTGHVVVDNASIAVTGSFWQSTQPVAVSTGHLIVDSVSTGHIVIDNASLAVTGTFWQSTQPVSVSTGHIIIDNASLAVTGTFWQSTQPVVVSTGHVIIDNTVTVSGTFFQSTQPVSVSTGHVIVDSVASTVSARVVGVISSTTTSTGPWQGLPAIGLSNDTSPQLFLHPLGAAGRSIIIEGFGGGTAVPVSGTFWQSTQPVSVSTGHVIVDNTVAVSGTFFQSTQPVSVSTGHIIVDNTVAVSGTFFQSTQPVAVSTGHIIVDNTVAVSGTFWQSTQPVAVSTGHLIVDSVASTADVRVVGVVSSTTTSTGPWKGLPAIGLSNDSVPQLFLQPLGAAGRSNIIEGFAGGTAVPVSGTFWQSTQPVAVSTGHIVVDNASLAVTGTFWQSTQPVAVSTGHIVVDNASLAVTGTFWQSTQPVAVSTGHIIIDSGTITTITNSVAVTGTFWQSTQPVAVSTGHVIVDSIGSTVTISGTVTAKEGPDATATFAPDAIDSTAYEASHVIKGASGVIYSLNGYNSKASAQFIQLHNSTSLPADAAVPLVIFTVPAASNFSYTPSDKFGKFFSVGITVSNSATGPTKTIGSADCWFSALYK